MHDLPPAVRRTTAPASSGSSLQVRVQPPQVSGLAQPQALTWGTVTPISPHSNSVSCHVLTAVPSKRSVSSHQIDEMSRNTVPLRASKLMMNRDQLHPLHLDRISKTDAAVVAEGNTANQLSRAKPLTPFAHLLVLGRSLCSIPGRMCYLHAVWGRIS